MKARELRELSEEELQAKGAELRKELFAARIRHATGQLENAAKMKTLRRDIARVQTVLRQKVGARA